MKKNVYIYIYTYIIYFNNTTKNNNSCVQANEEKYIRKQSLALKQVKDYHEKERKEWEKEKSELNRLIIEFQNTCIQYDKDIKNLKEVIIKINLYIYIYFF